MAIFFFSPDERIEVYVTVARKIFWRNVTSQGEKKKFKNTVVAYMLNRI